MLRICSDSAGRRFAAGVSGNTTIAEGYSRANIFPSISCSGFDKRFAGRGAWYRRACIVHGITFLVTRNSPRDKVSSGSSLDLFPSSPNPPPRSPRAFLSPSVFLLPFYIFFSARSTSPRLFPRRCCSTRAPRSVFRPGVRESRFRGSLFFHFLATAIPSPSAPFPFFSSVCKQPPAGSMAGVVGQRGA